jgi:hypothetical protein
VVSSNRSLPPADAGFIVITAAMIPPLRIVDRAIMLPICLLFSVVTMPGRPGLSPAFGGTGSKGLR